jgi:orotidine-5'-phosphate decarboxylase
MRPFGVRLRAAMDRFGPLCVGIDPHDGLLDAWELPRTVAGVERFALSCVEAFSGSVAIVKPQSAFFERYGAAGVAILERALAELREAGTLTILDAKRGDIGTTMAAYAQAFLSDDAPGRADALTVSPYLGFGSLTPALDLAAATGRGLFVLALTSNPEGSSVQHAIHGGRSVAGTIVDGVTSANAHAAARGELGSVGMVVGATVGSAVAELGLDLVAANAPLLAPGLGAQGAGVDDVRRVFGAALPQVLASSSREVLLAGPDVRRLRAAAVSQADALRQALSDPRRQTTHGSVA